MTTVRHLIFILQLFFPPELAIQQAIYILGVLISLYPVLRLHVNQLNEARRQTLLTGWMKSIQVLLRRAFHDEANDVETWKTGINLGPEYVGYICNDLDRLYTLLGLNNNNIDLSSFMFRPPRPILSTSRLNCKFCPPEYRNLVPSIRRRHKGVDQRVWLLDSAFKWVSADLVIGHCDSCGADYYPDRITRKGPGRKRFQVLEYDAEFLRLSKQGVWVHRQIAVAQEKMLHRFHAGWSNFALWLNDTTSDINVTFTHRQSQRLFHEHFARRLLIFHGKAEIFTCPAHSTAKVLAENVRELIGKDGGVLPTAMTHGCMDCTHVKKYGSVVEGENPGGEADIVGSTSGPIDPAAAQTAPLPAGLPETLPQQEAPPNGCPCGYCRMAVMDGKTLKHDKCALDDCRGPLVNYKNGRFCENHLGLANKCGIIPCGRPICTPDALTFRCVIRRQNAEGEASGNFHAPGAPSLQVQLQALGDISGDKVVHTFKAKSIYCVQIVQWACGVPIAWGKCYRSESSPQVLAFLNKTWDDYPQLRPSFMVYDKACELLRHIVTQDVNDLWLTSTKFIVDAWHYIGHRATDILCRTRCNPAPTNGSQPDLVLAEVDNNGVVHQTRAFNTETAEQLNSWLDGFEAQLCHMTDVNFDVYMHKKRELMDEFWDEVNGVGDMDLDA
ncbi:hypothetical protein DFH09DRAFT_1253344 [Mycena vulgaris]|nr:hypothetical protein DFH09DRAFT_1253344 [Mycena vulgaris]